jgi:hypothetical protein
MNDVENPDDALLAALGRKGIITDVHVFDCRHWPSVSGRIGLGKYIITLMRTAQLARMAEECGLCGCAIPKGTSYVVITRKGYAWEMKRCEECAGPEPVETAPSLEMSRMQRSQMLKIVERYDPKLRQLGEREAGSDDE